MQIAEERFEKVLIKRTPPKKAERKLCRRWCEAAERAPAPEPDSESLVRIDGAPLPLTRADDGHLEPRDVNEEDEL